MQWVISNQTLIQTALIYIILGYSLQIPLRAGVFSFAGAGFYTIGAYLAGVLVKDGWNPTLAVLATIVVSGVLGLALSVILTRLRALYLAMATLAVIFVVKLIAESLDVTGGTIGLLGVPLSTTTWHIAVITVVVTAAMWAVSRGRNARITEALRLDEVLASTMGISVLMQRNIVFVLSAMLGALAGALYALVFTVVIPDQMGFELVLTALTILVIGGTRHWAGVVIGAVIVAWLPTWLAGFGDWRPVVDGIVVVALAVFAANGVMGIWGHVVARFSKRRERVSSAKSADPAAEEAKK